MKQPTLQVIQRAHSVPNNIPISSAEGSVENLSTDLDHVFADLRRDSEISEAFVSNAQKEIATSTFIPGTDGG